MSSQISRRKKVFVGLSGGVDSAVSATLLVKAGYDVTGVFIKVWQPDWHECTWKDDRQDAMRVSAHLGINFVTLDLENEYKKNVIDYMIGEYLRGRTPNPDVMCNKSIKFGAFYDWAMKNGADFVATGHYARINDSMNRLLKGIDDDKDQSYFLWNIKTDQLKHIIFPIGKMKKTEVRKTAKKFDLSNHMKKDSQGLCFIGKVDFKEFLAKYLKHEKGNVLNDMGEIIGYHFGAMFFTIGERHGFVITQNTSNNEPYYVIDKDIEQNTITVGNKHILSEEPYSTRRIKISSTNFIGIDGMDNPTLEARMRYRAPLQKIKSVEIGIIESVVNFENIQTVAPGQSLVIYRGDECIGGGIIEE